MKNFFCENCGELVYFDNTVCLSCGCGLAFDPLDLTMRSFNGAGEEGSISLCKNYVEAKVCNWLVEEGSGTPFCVSCRTTRTIPDLSTIENKTDFAKMEGAKRAMVYDLLSVGLRPVPKTIDEGRGLAFDILDDTFEEKITTGHAAGLITLSMEEADDVERERRRKMLGEPVRTLLGHFRHEVGHYYWDRLIGEGSQEVQTKFRELFGDERVDYGESLNRYYNGERPNNWKQYYISEYATAHPWEDWAESWAHYLHIHSLVETARDAGLRLEPKSDKMPQFPKKTESVAGAQEEWADWPALSLLVNQLCRSLGHADPYPYTVPKKAEEKLAFVHEIIRQSTMFVR